MQMTAPLTVSSDLKRELPSHILRFLPITLFFPVAWMYAGFLLFVMALLVSGEWSEKWQRIRQHPMFMPTCLMFFVSLLSVVLHPSAQNELLSSFLHYQIYAFLLLLISVGPGVWQQRAIHTFFAGALIASTLFYCASLHLLPEATLFRSYVIYQGNKSILLGLLLAIAAAWMLQQWLAHQNHHGWRLLAFVYVVCALLVGSKSRTAGLLLISLLGIIACSVIRWRAWSMALGASLVLATFFLLYQAAHQAVPATCLAKEMRDRYQMGGLVILQTRAICTVQQVREFGKTGNVSEDGMRLQIYQNTWELIQEAPWQGHGMGQWLPLYQEKAKGSVSEKMTTPHNDYLLYWCELGIAGLVGLLLTWIWQWRIGVRMRRQGSVHGVTICLLSFSMMFAGAFNAILRDALFGLAMLILLAIPLASYSNVADQSVENDGLQKK